MESHDEVDKLFFELASESRLGILRELQSKKLRMQQIARGLDLTETETCRQLQRLSEAQLVQKQSDGTYALTTYAKLVLDLSLPMKFVFKNKEFFLNHDLFLLPKELRIRLGDLSESQMISTTIETINYVADMVKDAHEWQKAKPWHP